MKQSDNNLVKARKILKILPEGTTPMEKQTIKGIITNAYLLGGVKEDGSPLWVRPDQPFDMFPSALTQPGFRQAKVYYDFAIEKHRFSAAAIHLGTFYAGEYKNCRGKNCLKGEDPQKLSLQYFMKAAEMGNPIGMQKVGFHYNNRGDFHKAIEWYTKAAEQGKPLKNIELGQRALHYFLFTKQT
jgi:TPR repeat protein